MEHPLTAYRRRNRESAQAFGLRVGASKATISRIENGRQNPPLDLINRIAAATGGEVTANDLASAASERAA